MNDKTVNIEVDTTDGPQTAWLRPMASDEITIIKKISADTNTLTIKSDDGCILAELTDQYDCVIFTIDATLVGWEVDATKVMVNVKDETPDLSPVAEAEDIFIIVDGEQEVSDLSINPVFFPDRCAPHRDVSRETAFGIDSDSERTGSKIEIVGE